MTALVLNFQSLLMEYMRFPENQRSCQKGVKKNEYENITV